MAKVDGFVLAQSAQQTDARFLAPLLSRRKAFDCLAES